MTSAGAIAATKFLLVAVAGGSAFFAASGARADECRLPIPFHGEAETRLVEGSPGSTTVRQDWSSWSIDFDGDEVMLRWPANSHQHWNRFTVERCVTTAADTVELHYRSASADRAGDRNRLDMLRSAARDRHQTPSLTLRFHGAALESVEGFRFSYDAHLGELEAAHLLPRAAPEGESRLAYQVRPVGAGDLAEDEADEEEMAGEEKVDEEKVDEEKTDEKVDEETSDEKVDEETSDETSKPKPATKEEEESVDELLERLAGHRDKEPRSDGEKN